MSQLQKRSFGVILVESVMSNYNGNPDEDNTPRLTNDGYGLISPVCMKHRIRELIEDHDGVTWKLFKKRLNLNDSDFYIWESACKGYNVNTPIEAKKHWAKLVKDEGAESLVKRFWDMRVFGTTALETKGKDSLNFKRTGCVSVSPLISLLPVEIISQTITKGNPLEPERMEKNQGTIAPFGFKVARHALFIGAYVINPSRAHYTNTSQKDIDVFKSLVIYAFSNSTAAFRSGVRVVQGIHADHSDCLGSFNESEFFEACRPTTSNTLPSTKLSDYTFPSLDNLKKAFPGADIKMLTSFQSKKGS